MMINYSERERESKRASVIDTTVKNNEGERMCRSQGPFRDKKPSRNLLHLLEREKERERVNVSFNLNYF